MKSILFLLGVLFPVYQVRASEVVIAARYNISAWPRTSVSNFGCFLEKKFGYKDAKFNCSLKKYEVTGDPCKKKYYEGVAFPQMLAPRIHPLVKYIGLEWEHGELQSLTLEFTEKIDAQFVKKAFGLDLERIHVKNIMSAGIQDCTQGGACLIVLGFDHIGAGDISCERSNTAQ
jgi:hypothetical protein